ncbi:MAG: ABC transporter substrate-binding protein [Deltaproteobacteria bacterium]|nr:ABC transporter substrate-binding protein [Deltaproteobacteria bacterium]
MMRTMVVLVTVLGFFGSVALAKDEPLKRTGGLIDAFKSVKSAPEGKELTPADKKANAKAYRRLDGFFDWERLLGKPLEPHREKFSTEQLERCKAVFKQLIRIIAYPNSGDFFREAKYSIKQPVIKGELADVEMDGELVKEDFEIAVTFHWMDSESHWRIVDVSFDGASLVKDYQNQFGRIIDKEGAQGLLKRMEDRLQEEEEKRGKLP